ncbi:MAG: hypothetical protein ACQESR_02100 [Planctomycetota bacterium]
MSRAVAAQAADPLHAPDRDAHGESGSGIKSRIRFFLGGGLILQALGFAQVECCSTQVVLPWGGLAADKVIRDRYMMRDG